VYNKTNVAKVVTTAAVQALTGQTAQ